MYYIMMENIIFILRNFIYLKNSCIIERILKRNHTDIIINIVSMECLQDQTLRRRIAE